MTDQTKLAALAASARPESVIQEGVFINGVVSVKGGGPLLILGTINGDVVSEGSVAIGTTGAVNGMIVCRDADFGGVVNSPEKELQVRGLLRMQKTGVVIASRILYGELEHERGARLTGALVPIELTDAEKERLAPARTPTAPATQAQIAAPAAVTPVAARPAAAASAPFVAVVPASAAAVAAPTPHLSRVSVLPAHAPPQVPVAHRIAQRTDFSATQPVALEAPLARAPGPVTGVGELDMTMGDLRPLRAAVD